MLHIHDDIFDRKFLLEMSLWLLDECDWQAGNVANRWSHPYGIEGTHRLMGNSLYDNPEGKEAKFWEYVYKGDIGPLEHLWKMYSAIQTKAKNKCMVQGIQGNLQFMNMDGKFHLDGEDNQTVFIMMLAYHDIDENMGGEFYHESSGEKISFKQGRVMEMTASDSHRADAFNVPYIPRFSIKFTGLNSNNTSIYNKERI